MLGVDQSAYRPGSCLCDQGQVRASRTGRAGRRHLKGRD